MTGPLAQIEARKVVGGRTLLTEEERDALVEIAKAARKIADCNDYWDWVTGYAPALKAALSVLDDREET